MFGIQVHESVQVGRRYRYRAPRTGATLEFWAEGGLVCLEDQSTGEYVAWTQAEAREHFRVIGLAYTKIDIFSTSDNYFKDLRPDYRELLESIHAVLQDAKAQGDPTGHAVVQKKEAADIRTDLAAYAQSPQAVVVHDGVPRPLDLDADPRVRRLPNGAIHLPRGGGRKFERKYY